MSDPGCELAMQRMIADVGNMNYWARCQGDQMSDLIAM